MIITKLNFRNNLYSLSNGLINLYAFEYGYIIITIMIPFSNKQKKLFSMERDIELLIVEKTITQVLRLLEIIKISRIN